MVKHGPASGRWTLEQAGQICAEALKPSALVRSFDLRVGEAQFTVQAQSLFSRTFDILFGEQTVGVIRTVHVFTRRAVIECSLEIPEAVQLFAFWLAALTWKRSSKSE